MRKEYKIGSIGVAAISLLDILGSLAAKQFDFDYSSLWPLSLLLYFILAFWVARIRNYRIAVAFSAFLGLFDATIGWKINMWLGPELEINEILTVSHWLIALVLVVLFGAVVGLIAGGVAVVTRRRKP